MGPTSDYAAGTVAAVARATTGRPYGKINGYYSHAEGSFPSLRHLQDSGSVEQPFLRIFLAKIRPTAMPKKQRLKIKAVNLL